MSPWRGLDSTGGLARQQSGCEQGRQIEYMLADRNPCARRATVRRENPKRKVLNRKIWVIVGTGYPRAQSRIVGLIKCD